LSRHKVAKGRSTCPLVLSRSSQPLQSSSDTPDLTPRREPRGEGCPNKSHWSGRRSGPRWERRVRAVSTVETVGRRGRRMTDTHARARVWALCLAVLVLAALTGLLTPLAHASAPALVVLRVVRPRLDGHR